MPTASTNSSKTEDPVDLNQLYSTGQRDKAESIINTQQDRAVILNGMLTTGREILKRRKITKNILYIIFIIIILIALATLWFIFKAELPYYQKHSTDSSYEAPW